MIKRYSELIRIPTFEERYEYLRLLGAVGESTFGYDRIFNQLFYHSAKEWRVIRDYVISRDEGRDLAIPGREIPDRIYIHHMNPITMDDISNSSEFLLDPEYLICTAFETHNAIHFGDKTLLTIDPIQRTKNDTSPWKHSN